MGLLGNLKNFARDEINDETMELLEPYLNFKEDWFNFP